MNIILPEYAHRIIYVHSSACKCHCFFTYRFRVKVIRFVRVAETRDSRVVVKTRCAVVVSTKDDFDRNVFRQLSGTQRECTTLRNDRSKAAAGVPKTNEADKSLNTHENYTIATVTVKVRRARLGGGGLTGVAI